MKVKNIFFLILILIIFSCGDSIEKVEDITNLEGSADVEITNMESILNSSKLMKAKVTAPLAKSFATAYEPYMEFPKGLKAIFFDEFFNTMSSLTADYAINYTVKQLWKATGNVYIENVQGGTLQTEELFVDEANKKIYSLKYVKVTDADGSVVEGKGGFVSNFEFTEYEFKDVSGILEQKVDL